MMHQADFHKGQAVVWTDLNGVAFDASLNQTNIKNNNNKVCLEEPSMICYCNDFLFS